LLLPDRASFVRDRILATSVQISPTTAIARLPATQLLSALNYGFPLDEFTISFVPAALRSFVHHFHPAYTIPLNNFVLKTKTGDDKNPVNFI